MKEQETNWVLAALAQWLRAPAKALVCPPELDPTVLGTVLERNRLLPLFRTVTVAYPAGAGWDRLRARLDEGYRQSLMQGLQQMKSGNCLLECLRREGIPALAVRGPYLAEDVYGDVALRLSSDVDILITERDRRRAWPICRAAGYRSLDWECPLWPVDKHRIHWRIQRVGDPVVCELHWAAEPVYGAMTFDYEALVREGSVTQRFLLLCLHVGGHAGDVSSGSAVLTSAQVADAGMLFRWIDVAMFLREYGSQVDWGVVDECSRDRRVGASLVLCMAGVRDWLGVDLGAGVERLLDGWAVSAQAQRSAGWRRRIELAWAGRPRRGAGLQTSLPDVLYFLWPYAMFFDPARGAGLWVRRVWHGIRSMGILARETLSYGCFALLCGLRRRFCRRAAALSGVLALAAGTLLGHDFGDDYGDTADTACPLVCGSNVAGRIEIDVDRDWFSFVAAESTNEYVITVSTGSLWNSTAWLAAPDGRTSLVATDSVTAVSSRIAWIHVGPPATYFVRVGGFADFTTGTYSMVVNRQAYADLDHDGMPDAWEQAYFQSTNQPPAGDYDHDGVSNRDEFLAGTDPVDPASRFRLTGMGVTNGGRSVVWAAVPFRCYEVEVATNLVAGGWASLGAVTNLAALDSLRIEDAVGGSPARFYRVRLSY